MSVLLVFSVPVSWHVVHEEQDATIHLLHSEGNFLHCMGI